MAEYLFKKMIKEQGLSDMMTCASAATSTEEIGNPVHPGTKKILAKQGIHPYEKRAVQMKASDYDTYDYLIGMDSANIRNMKMICGEDPKHKIYRLLDYTKHPRDVADPWYTGDFETTYRDVSEGCCALMKAIQAKL